MHAGILGLAVVQPIKFDPYYIKGGNNPSHQTLALKSPTLDYNWDIS